MATEKQIAANRENKQRSQNALRHGFIILPGQEAAFTQLEADLRINLLPNGPLQEVIFKRALESAWNLERCRLAELKLHATLGSPNLDPLLDNGNEARYARIHKFAREAENSLYKAMRELGKLQTENQYRHEAYPLTQAELDNPDLFNQTPHVLSAVCSITQVVASLNRDSRNEAKTHGQPPGEHTRRKAAA